MITCSDGVSYNVTKNDQGEFTFWRIYEDNTGDFPRVMMTQLNPIRFIDYMEQLECDWEQYFPEAYEYWTKTMHL